MLPISTPYGSSRSASRVDNGLAGMKTVNRSVVLSIAWLFGSIFVVVFGLWHCSSTSYNYKMTCDAEKCSFVYPKGSLWEPTVTLERANILYAENVHWDDIKKAQVDTKGMASRKISKLGMTVAVKYNQYLESNPDQKELRTLVFPPVDMGRRKARQTLRKVKEYLNEKEEKDELDQQHGKMVTALGVVCIIFGITSVILSLALGSWKDEKLQRVRRNFVKGRMKRRD